MTRRVSVATARTAAGVSPPVPHLPRSRHNEIVRTLLLAGLVLAVLAVPVGSVAAGPGTISVISITTSSKATDKSPKGPSAGDTYVTTSRLVNAVAQFGRKKGAVVGTDRATTTFSAVRSARIAGTATLPGGTLTVRGRLKEQADSTFVAPVVSGTGAFKGARGTVTINGTDKRASNVYKLTY